MRYVVHFKSWGFAASIAFPKLGPAMLWAWASEDQGMFYAERVEAWATGDLKPSAVWSRNEIEVIFRKMDADSTYWSTFID